ncbi:MAG: streptogramin lyase [Flavobacteriales bacterium]|jgi:streptogramin lyase
MRKEVAAHSLERAPLGLLSRRDDLFYALCGHPTPGRAVGLDLTLPDNEPIMRNTLLVVATFVALLASCSSSPTGGGSTQDAADAGVDTTTDALGDAGTCEDPDDDGYGVGCDAGLDCAPDDATRNPGSDEICGNRLDDNCDDAVDEGCECTPGRVEACYTGPEGTSDRGECSSGARACIDGEWSPCDGERVPAVVEETLCNGVDEDCDGVTDDGLLNACGECGAVSLEVCGDGLDNDCNGIIDDADAGCDCDGRLSQPCYSGPPLTLGVGSCRGGAADCVEDEYGSCGGQVLPQPEVCDGLDNDCDGDVDEGVRNRCGQCGLPDPIELCNGLDDDCDGVIDEGVRLSCGVCPGEESVEICDGFDNDCDGTVDEECACGQGEAACYPGPIDAAGVGQCIYGTRGCSGNNEFWGACAGYGLPTGEICDGEDNDCDGQIDIGPNGCSVCDSEPELCDGVDNNCDGRIDEGLRNACGVCFADAGEETLCDGLDDNCDGLIDEGLLNACGLCDDSCFVASWDEPEEWLVGDFDGVSDTDLQNGLRLGEGRLALPDLWVANTDDNTVTRIDTDEARAVATFPVGPNPSRTAVDFEGNVYVAARAFDGQGTVTKIQRNDCIGEACVLWEVDIGDINAIPRGLAIDRQGFPWVGTYNDGMLRRLDPETGEIVHTTNVGVDVYGLAIDSEGIIWVSTISATGVAAYDTVRDRVLGAWRLPDCTTPYGIAVDANGDVWMGTYRCNELVRLRRDSFESGDIELDRYTHPNLQETRGVAVDGDGAVYVAASGTNRLGRFDPITESFTWTVGTCEEPIGVGIARDGNIWVACKSSDAVRRYQPDGTELQTVDVGNGPYSYSDLTGFQLRNFTAPNGDWTVRFDCGYAECRFDELVWDASLPSGTTVAARARVRVDSDSEWSEWSAFLDNTPAAIGQLLPRGQELEVQVLLSTQDREFTPSVTSVGVRWQRP